MNYLGIEVPVANTPELDPGFIPLGKFLTLFSRMLAGRCRWRLSARGERWPCTTPLYTALPTWPRPTVTTSTAW